MNPMPLLFVGHGSPMNAIEKNEYTSNWKQLALEIPKPKAILSISGHWFTTGTRTMDEAHPKVINDMYGFPKELYEVNYTAPGAPELAHETVALISRKVSIDNSWGLDHGTWSILNVMYPEKNIPVYQLSIDQGATPLSHYEMGQQLKVLRDKGVLILGSGNVVHNLRSVNFSEQGGYKWANQFDDYIQEQVSTRQHENVMDYKKIGQSAQMSVPSTDHLDPLFYILGASDPSDQIRILNNACMAGSLSMTSYVFDRA